MKQESAKCPKCDAEPILVRSGSAYWRVKCEKYHIPYRIEGPVMKTQKDAIAEWNKMCSEQKFQ